MVNVRWEIWPHNTGLEGPSLAPCMSERISYEILLLTYKTPHGKAQAYICLVCINQPSHNLDSHPWPYFTNRAIARGRIRTVQGAGNPSIRNKKNCQQSLPVQGEHSMFKLYRPVLVTNNEHYIVCVLFYIPKYVSYLIFISVKRRQQVFGECVTRVRVIISC